MSTPADALGLSGEPADGYGLRPARWSQPWAPGPARLFTVIGALLVGYLLVVGLNTGRDAAAQADARKADLVALVRARQDRTDALSAQLETLRTAVGQAETAAAAGLPVMRRQVEQIGQAAGISAVRGPGLRVTFADAAQRGNCASGRPEDCRIQDADLQAGLNEVFAAGAEAVAVNGQRVIATTAVRSAGGAILVNYRVLRSPYVLEAIGNPEVLRRAFTDSQLSGDFGVWRDVYGLGFAITIDERLQLPAYEGSLRLRTARPPQPERSTR